MVSTKTSVSNAPTLMPPTVHRHKGDTTNKRVVQHNTTISACPSASKYGTVTATVLPPVLSAALNSGVPPPPAVSISTNNTPTSFHLTIPTASNAHLPSTFVTTMPHTTMHNQAPASSLQLQQLHTTSCSPIALAGPVANLLQQFMHNSQRNAHPAMEPFILKFKTGQIRICQSCRQGFSEDTQLVIARSERHLDENVSTGVKFMGRPSNSHYHIHLACIQLVYPQFMGHMLIIPEEVKERLTTAQKKTLVQQLQVPQEHL